MTARPALVVHGGAGARAEELEETQAAVERALAAGWAEIGRGALAAAIAAVSHMEDEPLLNAGIGSTLNEDGIAELDAGVMEGTTMRAGGVAAVRDVRHPVDLARAVLEDGRHVLLVGDGASRFARDVSVETCDPAIFVTDRQRQRWRTVVHDTVGAVACDAKGRVAVAVSTGGVPGKLPGRVGDSAIPGAGFYADDSCGAACGTGTGESFMRLCLCKDAVDQLGEGRRAERVAQEAVDYLTRRVGGMAGVIVVSSRGDVGASWNTDAMPWASRVG